MNKNILSKNLNINKITRNCINNINRLFKSIYKMPIIHKLFNIVLFNTILFIMY